MEFVCPIGLKWLIGSWISSESRSRWKQRKYGMTSHQTQSAHQCGKGLGRTQWGLPDHSMRGLRIEFSGMSWAADIGTAQSLDLTNCKCHAWTEGDLRLCLFVFSSSRAEDDGPTEWIFDLTTRWIYPATTACYNFIVHMLLYYHHGILSSWYVIALISSQGFLYIIYCLIVLCLHVPCPSGRLSRQERYQLADTALNIIFFLSFQNFV